MIDRVNKQRSTVLVRYGLIPEVARCDCADAPGISRGEDVLVETHRGLELGTVLEQVQDSLEPDVEQKPASFKVVSKASEADLQHRRDQLTQSQQQFQAWEDRIAEWNLDLQLIDLEWTLDEKKLVLYVLNERGPECTKLALQAAAAGLGIVDVQPVSLDGLVTLPSGGGCGSGGCGCKQPGNS